MAYGDEFYKVGSWREYVREIPWAVAQDFALEASRTALVATARIDTAPEAAINSLALASIGNAATIASRLMRPSRKTLSPRRVTSRSVAMTMGACPGSTSTTNMRVELLPMSTAA